jgi:hypothetical protein
MLNAKALIVPTTRLRPPIKPQYLHSVAEFPELVGLARFGRSVHVVPVPRTQLLAEIASLHTSCGGRSARVFEHEACGAVGTGHGAHESAALVGGFLEDFRAG